MVILGALERIPEAISALVTSLGLGPVGYMLVMNVIFIFAGMVLDIPVALALLVPLLAPVALAQGADPVHLGIVLCFNLCIGLISPPMGGVPAGDLCGDRCELLEAGAGGFALRFG